jgi:hypothetical protein
MTTELTSHRHARQGWFVRALKLCCLHENHDVLSLLNFLHAAHLAAATDYKLTVHKPKGDFLMACKPACKHHGRQKQTICM